MLGRIVSDPNGEEGPAGSDPGLGLLDIETTLARNKSVRNVTGRHLPTNTQVSGYEIHLGVTTGPDCLRPPIEIGGRPDGAATANGRIWGTYVHGLFGSDPFRKAFLGAFGLKANSVSYAAEVETTLDALATHMETHLDIDGLLSIALPGL